MEQLLHGLVSGLAPSLASTLNEIVLLVTGLVLAAPAIGSVLLLILERRLTFAISSMVAAAASGVLLVLIGASITLLAFNAARVMLPVGYRMGPDFVVVAMVLSVLAIVLQMLAWESFTKHRAVALLCMVITLPVMAKADDMLRLLLS